MERKLRSQVTGWENAHKREKNKTIPGSFLGEQISPPIHSDEEEQWLPSGKDIKVKASVSQTSKINIQWSQAMEELIKRF